MEFFSFVLGAIVGSFMNVVVLRLGTGNSFIHGRSRCFSCNKILSWSELIPLVSFLVQRGKCRSCSSRISPHYFFGEFSTGLLFLFSWQLVPFSPLLFLLFPIMALFVGVVSYDYRHKIIPDQFSILLGIFSLVFLFATQGFSWWGIFAGPLVAFPFAFFFFISRGAWMGFGDAKLALSIGWFLGLSAGYTALILASWIGALFGIALLLVKGKGLTMRGEELPFAPFLVLGTLITFFGELTMDSLILFFL